MEKCICVLKTGSRAGEPCGAKAKQGAFCGRHLTCTTLEVPQRARSRTKLPSPPKRRPSPELNPSLQPKRAPPRRSPPKPAKKSPPRRPAPKSPSPVRILKRRVPPPPRARPPMPSAPKTPPKIVSLQKTRAVIQNAKSQYAKNIPQPTQVRRNRSPIRKPTAREFYEAIPEVQIFHIGPDSKRTIEEFAYKTDPSTITALVKTIQNLKKERGISFATEDEPYLKDYLGYVLGYKQFLENKQDFDRKLRSEISNIIIQVDEQKSSMNDIYKLYKETLGDAFVKKHRHALRYVTYKLLNKKTKVLSGTECERCFS